MTSPANGSSISTTTTFTWSTGSGNDKYWLYVGTTSGGREILSEDQFTNTSRTLSNLPAGKTIYITLWSRCGSSQQWSINQYSYTVQGGGTVSCAAAQMTSPANGSSISSTTTFTWNAGSGNDDFWLYVGTTSGGREILSEEQGTRTTRTLSNLPVGAIYITLWSRCSSSQQWSLNQYSYTRSAGSLSSPGPEPNSLFFGWTKALDHSNDSRGIWKLIFDLSFTGGA